MKKALVLQLALWILAAPLGAAQLYRWVDEKGNVEWRDTPPPPTAKKVEQRKVGATPAPGGELPYSLQLAVKNFPVTLWTTSCGDACDKARAHLSRRGVPHTEKNPQSDFETFKKVTGGSEVPVLFVGNNRVKGYLEPDWDAALDFAGYPKTALVQVKPKPAPDSPQKPAPAEAGPVRLYTNTQCGPNCDEARKLLAGRGIGFQEIAVETPPQIEDLRKLSGDTFVPVLVSGRFVVRGFSPSEYNRALDESGHRREQ